MVESSGLLNRRRGLNLYRGFESPPLRQPKPAEIKGLEHKRRNFTQIAYSDVFGKFRVNVADPEFDAMFANRANPG